MYCSLPIVWMVLLYRLRHRLNPPLSKKSVANLKTIMIKRNADTKLKPLAFLYSVYQPGFYYMESIEMYRRILFVSALPLLSAKMSRRAAIGVFFALLSAICYREVQPFARGPTNILVHCAQYAILLTFGSALAIETGLMHNFDELAFGLILLGTNLLVLLIALAMGGYRHYVDERLIWKWQRLLTTNELRIVEAVMEDSVGGGGDDGPDMGGMQLSNLEAKGSASARERNSERLLRQCLLSAKDVALVERVGAGAFGEVRAGLRRPPPFLPPTPKKIMCATTGHAPCLLHDAARLCLKMLPTPTGLSRNVLRPRGGGEDRDQRHRGKPEDLSAGDPAHGDAAPPLDRQLRRGVLGPGAHLPRPRVGQQGHPGGPALRHHRRAAVKGNELIAFGPHMN